VKRKLRELADEVISGRADRANAAVAGQLLGTFLHAVSVELAVKEQEKLEGRIDALEQMQPKAGARDSWPR
jgi:hypothetical protein